MEAQRRCAKKRKEENRKNDVCGAERDPRDEGKDDENKEKDFESDDDVEDLINECINEQKEKEEEVRTTWERPFSRQPKLTEKMAGGVEKSEAC